MSFITESKKAYKQVKENHVAIAMGNMLDDEGSMILNQLEELERGIEMLRTYVGNDYEKQLPAWVQSKVTLATDYISTVGNYLSSKNEKATEESIKESFSLEENTFEKIYQMQQDGKSTEDIAKELKLNPALVKKVLGEQIELKEFTDAMLAALKKEYEPLKGKTITTAQYQQLKNILFKLQDADLEKLQKQNIPFASTGAGSILRVRKSPVKITSVKVPGLEGMAEENQYVAVHVKKGKTSVTANSSYEAAKKASEKFGLNNTTGITVMLAKKDGEDVIHKATEGVEVTEEPKNPYAIGMAAAMKATGDTPPLKKSTITKAHKIADKVKEEEVELNDLIKEIEEIEEAISSDELNLNEGNFNAFLNVASRITKLKSDLQKLDKSKPDSKDKEEIIKSRIATAELKMKNIQQKQKAEKERQKKDPEYKVDYSKIGKKEEVNKESTSRNINEGARALVEAITALQKKADKTGMPYSILKQVYDRGMAAWKGGHRPGAGQHQWAFARVNSFVTKSSGTWGGADSDLAKKVKGKE